MPTSETQSVPGDSPLVRCVVLCAPGTTNGPGDLIRALKRKQLALQIANNPFEAMAHLVRRLDESVPAASRGMALVIVEPKQHGDGLLQSMLASLARYAPLTTLWAYDEDASPKLHSYVPGDGDSSADGEPEIHVKPGLKDQLIEATLQRRAHKEGSPSLRLAGEGQVPPGASDLDDLDDEIDPTKLMSQDELSMLLDDDLDG
ncbi:MAG: hypothetical protein ACYTF7_05310 [Planctomycetota bacterium]|jgi:hypothetical protein